MRKIEVKIRQLFWAFTEALKPTNYDLVIFQGKRYYIKSSLTGYNIWNLFEKNNSEPIHKYIKGNNLKVVHSIKRFIPIFKQKMYFQKSCWQKLDFSNPFGTRLSYLNSNNIYYRKRYI